MPLFIQNDRLIMNTANVTSKGRLVVPSRIRRRLGIKPGTRVNFVEEGRDPWLPDATGGPHSSMDWKLETQAVDS